LTAFLSNDDTITAIATTGEAFGTNTIAAIVTPAATGIDVTKWLMAAGSGPAFAKFTFTLAAARSAALPFLSTTMINLLDYIEYVWIYSNYNN